MVDEAVGQHHRPHAQAGIQHPGQRQMLQHEGAEAADRALLDGDQHLMFAGQPLHQPGIQRLGETGIGDRGGQAIASQFLGGGQAFLQPRAIGQDGDRRAFAQDTALADLQRLAARRQFDASTLAAWIAHGGRPVVDGRTGGYHMHQLRLVGCRHQHEIRQTAQIGDIEAAGMGCAISTDQPGAVDGEAHRQALNRHIVHHLVIAALQEGGIDRGERLHPLRRHTGGEGHGMLFGDTDIEDTIREPLGELVQPGPARHGGGDGDDALVGLRLLDQRLGEDIGVAGRVRLRLHLCAGDQIELLDRVIFLRAVLGEGVTPGRAGFSESAPDG